MYHSVFPRTAPTIRGQYILVTGAASGMGRATASVLAKMKNTVYALDVNEGGLQELHEEFPENIIPVQVDLQKKDEVEGLKDRLRLDRLDALISVAGICVFGPLVESDYDIEYETVMDVNLRAPMRLVKEFYPLLKQSQGRIVLVSSGSSFSRIPFLGVYTLSKSALESYADTLRREISQYNVKVSVVVPTAIDTPMWDSLGALKDKTKGLEVFEDSEFYVNMKKTEQFLRSMRPIALSPNDVAIQIISCLRSRYPKIRYVVDRTPFLTQLSWSLPDWMNDFILPRLCHS